MARPSKSDNRPAAEERIKASFWDLFQQKPLERISVKEVCDAAGCNKTTFYYHFQDLRELLDTIEEECLPIEAPEMLLQILVASDKEAFIACFLERMGERFEKYCLLLSSHGDPGFAKKAKSAMTNRWCESLGLVYDSLDCTDKMTIRFAMSGAVSIFADHGDGEPFDADAFANVILIAVMPLAIKLNLIPASISLENETRV